MSSSLSFTLSTASSMLSGTKSILLILSFAARMTAMFALTSFMISSAICCIIFPKLTRRHISRILSMAVLTSQTPRNESMVPLQSSAKLCEDAIISRQIPTFSFTPEKPSALVRKMLKVSASSMTLRHFFSSCTSPSTSAGSGSVSFAPASLASTIPSLMTSGRLSKPSVTLLTMATTFSTAARRTSSMLVARSIARRISSPSKSSFAEDNDDLFTDLMLSIWSLISPLVSMSSVLLSFASSHRCMASNMCSMQSDMQSLAYARAPQIFPKRSDASRNREMIPRMSLPTPSANFLMRELSRRQRHTSRIRSFIFPTIFPSLKLRTASDTPATSSANDRMARNISRHTSPLAAIFRKASTPA
mmetsp:Transcript_12795/g.37621  ORF Transcript_12795/g.37621 Transcript_12795/m.37621 type:complete len:361 (+) Transcript_12795:160-1242(+)